MSNSKDYIQKNKAAFFDWLVFSTSFCLGFIFPSLKDFVISPWFSYWMLSALLLYTSGVWLKHLPLYYRIIKAGHSQKKIPYVLFLIIGHLLILLTVTIFAESAVRKILDLPSVSEKNIDAGSFIFGNILTASFITWLVFRTGSKIKSVVRLSEKYLFRRELIADILLIAGVAILSFAFWEKGIIALIANKPATTIGDVWFLFIFLAIAYMLFYLPLRYLFLIEDHFSRNTWKRMLFIFALLLLKSLFEMIRI